jgi:hypothetical protein
MNSFFIDDLARITIAQRHRDAAAHRQARVARAAARATKVVTRLTNRPRVPAQRQPEQSHRQPEFVGGERVRG